LSYIKKTYSIFDFLLILITLFLLIFFTKTVSNDYKSYELIYDAVKQQQSFTDLLFFSRYEPGFIAVYYYLSDYLSSFNLFILIGSIVLILKYEIFKRYLRRPKIAWIIYIIIFLPFSEANQIRSSIATTIILYVICSPETNKKYLFNAIFAAIFHYVGIIIYFFKFNKRPILLMSIFCVMLLLTIDIIAYINNFLNIPLTFISTATNNFPNPFNSNVIMQWLIFIFCIYKWNYLNYNQKQGALLISMGLLSFYLMMGQPSMAHRIREISNLGIFPLVFSSKKISSTHFSLVLYVAIIFLILYHLVFTVDELMHYY